MKRRLARLRRALAVAGVIVLGAGGPAHAQSESELEVISVDAAAHPTVRLVVAAPRPLFGADIPPDAFEVRENGAVREITLRQLPLETLEVVLVIDTSGSMAGAPMAAAQAAATAFVEQMPPDTPIAVVAFGATATVASPFDTDREALTGVIANLAARGETALYDAVATTAEVIANAPPATRRAVVLLSDGGDTVSVTTLEAAVTALSGLDTDFAAVALQTTEADAAALDQLAAATGGRVVPATDPGQLGAAYGEIASRLVNRYEIAYLSESEHETVVAVSIEHAGVRASADRSVTFPALPRPTTSPPRTVVPGLGLLDGRWTLLVGGAAFAASLGLAGWFLASPREFKRRLAREFEHAQSAASPVASLSEHATALAERVLDRRGATNALNQSLDRAGIAMRPGEFVVLGATSAISAAALGLFLGGIIVAGVLALVTMIGFRQALAFLGRRRQRQFAEQLGDTLQLLAGSLRTGYGLGQAIDVVAREADGPTSDEFRRIVIEARLGRDLSDALHATAERVGGDDFEWVVQAIDIHRETGGDLAEIFDRVGETIRDRNHSRRQVRALSAEGRLSGVILFVLPFAIGALIRVINPEYANELTGTSAGKTMLLIAGVFLLAGGVWLKRIVRLDF